MGRWVYALIHLIVESQTARRDARVRFLRSQVEILRRKLGGNRVVPSPEDRMQLLRIGAELRHEVAPVLGIVAAQTYGRWVRELRSGKQARPAGRPKVKREWRELALRLARENLGWVYRRIVGELRKLRVRIGRSTIRRVLIAQGVTPSPNRGGGVPAETPWRSFIKLHLNTLVACDFFTKNVITPFGLRVAYCLFFIHVGTRKVFICPATYQPNERWMKQQARNVMMWLNEAGLDATHLLHDRDEKFTRNFRQILRAGGIRSVRTPVRAPNANAFAETWVGAIKRECLNHFVCFGRGHLDHIIGEFVRFFNTHRPHQGLGNRTLPEANAPPNRTPTTDSTTPLGRVRCLPILGGLLKHYYRTAA